MVVESGRVPRVARLLALAHRMDRLVRDGQVKNYADLARVGHAGRSRISQILNLLLLAPDLQEVVLFLPRTVSGRDPMTERQLRRVVAIQDWEEQRRLWGFRFHGEQDSSARSDQR